MLLLFSFVSSNQGLKMALWCIINRFHNYLKSCELENKLAIGDLTIGNDVLEIKTDELQLELVHCDILNVN